MSYHPPDVKNELDELNRKIGVLRNISRTSSVGINIDTAAFGAGSSSSVGGKNHGVQYFTPQTSVVTVDGSSRRHVNVSSTIMIINEYGTNSLTLHYIDNSFNNGQYVIIRPLAGKTLTLKKATTLDNTTGNLYLDNDIILNENDFITLVFMKDLGTGGGMFAQEITGVGSGGTVAWSQVTPIDVDKDMNNHSFSNFNILGFHSSGNPSNIAPSGDGTTININVNGIYSGGGHFVLSNSSLSQPNGVLQINGVGAVTPSINTLPSLKIFNNSLSPTGTAPMCGMSFDQNNASLTRKTFVQLVQSSAGVLTAGSEQGKLDIYAIGSNTLSNIASFYNNGAGGTFQIYDTFGQSFTLTKLFNSYTRFDSDKEFEFGNNVLPADLNTQTLGNSIVPWFNGFFLNHEIIAGSGSSQFFKQNISTNFINYLLNSSSTNTGHNFQVNSIQFLQLVHNTSNDPINFLYVQQPIWLEGGDTNTYIQFDSITTAPANPPTHKARLYVKTSGAGDSLIIKWADGTTAILATH